RRVPVDTVSPVVFSIALPRRYDGYTFAPRVRAFKTGCADGYVRERGPSPVSPRLRIPRKENSHSTAN
ncbi:hypothetical protein VSR69_45690, partial [Paraburkholderia phytofirmans]